MAAVLSDDDQEFRRSALVLLARLAERLKGLADDAAGTVAAATSMTAPIASGRSDSCRVGLAPTEERRLATAHSSQTFIGLCD